MASSTPALSGNSSIAFKICCLISTIYPPLRIQLYIVASALLEANMILKEQGKRRRPAIHAKVDGEATHQAGGARFTTASRANSRTAMPCSRDTEGKASRNVSRVSPASRYSIWEFLYVVLDEFRDTVALGPDGWRNSFDPDFATFKKKVRAVVISIRLDCESKMEESECQRHLPPSLVKCEL